MNVKTHKNYLKSTLDSTTVIKLLAMFLSPHRLSILPASILAKFLVWPQNNLLFFLFFSRHHLQFCLSMIKTSWGLVLRHGNGSSYSLNKKVLIVKTLTDSLTLHLSSKIVPSVSVWFLCFWNHSSVSIIPILLFLNKLLLLEK